MTVCALRVTEKARENPEGWRRDHDLRPARRQGSNREEHDARARTPQAARGRQALRSSRSPQLQRQAVCSLQGPQVRESQRQESFQRLQEVKCHQLISVASLLSLSSLSCDSATLMVTYLLCIK